MKLGVSYNLFDGEELLEGSIKQIRDHIDYISVVCQTTSNFGKPCSEDLLPLLKRLKKEKLIDEVLLYTPQIENGGHFNEIQKRNVGLKTSLKVNCTHHMSMDCDEYYISSEFENLKKLIEEGNYDSSYCQMLSYYKSWEYYLDPPEDYYVSLITKIDNNSQYVLAAPAPVLVDPTRRIYGLKKPLILKRNQIQMHHGSYVRKDIRSKLENSSASVNFVKDIERLVEYYNNWTYPNKVMWGGLPSTLKNVKQCTPIFEL
jgi:hypothetical protein